MPLKEPVKCKAPECTTLTRSVTRYCNEHAHMQEKHVVYPGGTFNHYTGSYRKHGVNKGRK